MKFKTLKALFAVVAIASFLPLAACNTVEGMGQDTQVAGEAVSDTARDAKH